MPCFARAAPQPHAPQLRREQSFSGTHDKRAKAAVIEWMIGQRSVMGHTAKASVAMSLGAYTRSWAVDDGATVAIMR